MATSVLCSIAVHLVYVQFVYETVGEPLRRLIAKRLCIWRESKIKRSKIETIKSANIKYVAGLDISVHNNFDGYLAVSSCTLCAYPDLKVSYFCNTFFTYFTLDCLFKR
jgi:hypothetical protein